MSKNDQHNQGLVMRSVIYFKVLQHSIISHICLLVSDLTQGAGQLISLMEIPEMGSKPFIRKCHFSEVANTSASAICISTPEACLISVLNVRSGFYLEIHDLFTGMISIRNGP